MNNSTKSHSSYSQADINYVYITIGSAAILTNCAILVTLLTKRNLLVNYAFDIGLAFGDVLNGIAILGNGASRLHNSVQHIPNTDIHPFQCMLQYTAMYLAGHQIPGAMFA